VLGLEGRWSEWWAGVDIDRPASQVWA